VTDWLTTTLTVVSLLLAAVATGYVVLDRATDDWLLGLVGLLAVGTVVQLVTGAVALARTDADVSGPSFVGYLIALVLVPPAATIWALGERSRAGTSVLIVAGLLVPFLMLRLGQIWTAAGG
jgi:hypothetical protein